MSFLMSERRSRLRLLLHTLAEGQRDHEEIARLDAQIRLDYHGRFLIELVQNAVDPAQRAGLTAANILIIHTQDLLAVLNQGAPFDDGGLRSILSLALSSKRPDEAIGNKGVGFKSVFEVADAADVYGVTHAAEGLGRSPGLRFRVRRTGTALAESVVAEALAILAEAPDLAQQIAARCADRDASEGVRRALQASPAWRYPEELSEKAWVDTLRALGLSKADLSKYQTAVVLRLDSAHHGAVDRAVADFSGGDAEPHLFLPAVGCIEIRQAEGTTVLERADIARSPSSGVELRRLRRKLPDGSKSESWWWIASGVVSGPALEAAVASLPGEGWHGVRRAEVQVALPVPEDDGPLGPAGRYYVGLPTREGTGSPFFVDARFHATLSRTGLDRRDNPYNVLLDREAVNVAANLVRALRSFEKGDPAGRNLGAARRAVTLSLASGGDRHFASAVRQALRDEPVVLLDGGARFALPAKTRRISEEDTSAVALIEERLGRSALSQHGVERVDRMIEESSSSLLAELGVPAMKPAELLERPSGGRSIVERLAKKLLLPDEGWAILLTWFASRVVQTGDDQRLLPGADGGLLTVGSRPFLPLVSTPEPGELRDREVPAGLLVRLPFVHPAALEGADGLRRVLAEGKRPLAQRPVPSAVIRLAVIPAMNLAIDGGDHERARELLALALRLLSSVAATENVTDYGWQVPCVGGWKAADVAYLGDAWSDGRDEDSPPGVVELAFAPEGRCLIEWWGPPEEKASARAALLRIGLDDTPRVLVHQPVEQAIWGDYRRGTPNASAPDGVPEAAWAAWIGAIAASGTVDWGPQTWWTLHNVEWVDGLDLPEAGPAVAAWALTVKPDDALLRAASTRGSRSFKQGADFLNLWPFTIRQMDAAVVPSHPSCSLKGRLARPDELCRLLPTNKDVPAWLPRVADGLDGAALQSVGVRTLNEMPASWLVAQLSSFGATLDPARKNSVAARGLWRLLNARARTESLGDLGEAVLPVWLGGSLVGVRGDEVARLVIVDNAYDAEVLGDQLDGVLMLDPEVEDWRPLLGRLSESLTSARIELVSELDYPYGVAKGAPTGKLVGLIAEALGQGVVYAIGALLRQPKQGVGAKDVEKAWGAFGSASVQVGVLPQSAPPAVWLAADQVLVCQAISPAEVVAAMWPVLGAVWRHQLLALGHALGRGDRPFRDFLRHEGLTESMLDEAASRLGASKLIAPYLAPAGSGDNGLGSPLTAAVPSLELVGAPITNDAGDLEEVIDLEAARDRVRSAPVVIEPGAQIAGGAGLPPPLPGPAPRPGPVRSGARGDEEYARMIGHYGEHFAFRALSAMLPGFDESCWKSSSRSLAGLPGGDDTLGYDFRYIDIDGTLSGQPGAECYIEVKANARGARARFSLSNNEWQLAVACHSSPDRRFVVVRVAGIADAPAVVAIIVDPVQAVREGQLALTPKDGWWVDHDPASHPPVLVHARGDDGRPGQPR